MKRLRDLDFIKPDLVMPLCNYIKPPSSSVYNMGIASGGRRYQAVMFRGARLKERESGQS